MVGLQSSELHGVQVVRLGVFDQETSTEEI